MAYVNNAELSQKFPGGLASAKVPDKVTSPPIPVPTGPPKYANPIRPGDEELVFRPYHWEVYDKAGANDNVQILMWGLDRDSNKICGRIENFPVTAQIELPLFVYGRPYNWNPQENPAAPILAMNMINTLSKKLEKEGHEPVPPQPNHFNLWKKLYYFQGMMKFPMMMVQFRNEDSMRHARNILKYKMDVEGLGENKFEMWESEIPLIVKFITRCQIKHCSWIRTGARRVEPAHQISTIANEFMIDWFSLEEVPANECKNWHTYPTVFSYDIEQYTDRHMRFPERDNHKHVVWIITVVVQNFRTNERKRYAILLGDCKDISPEKSDKFKNLEIVRVRDEVELIQNMCRLMQEHDPEVLTGYRTLSYDNPTLHARLKVVNFEEWPRLGRLKDQKYWGRLIGGKNWHSSGAGFNAINELYCPGRICLDMYQVVKREGYKFVNYDLDTVGEEFCGYGKNNMTPQRMFRAYEAMQKGMAAGPGTPEYEKGLTESQEVVEYGIIDSELVLDLFVKLKVWISAIEMSNAGGVTISEFYLRGQQLRVMSLLYRIGTSQGFVLDMQPVLDIPYKGGAVCDPKPGLHPIALVFDFESLYPSITDAYNICFTTLVHKKLMNYFPEQTNEDCLVLEIDCDQMVKEDEEWNGKKVDDDMDVDEEGNEIPNKPASYGKMKLKFVQKVNGQPYRGLLPQLCRGLINERRVVKDLIKAELAKDEPDEIYLAILDRRQLALKIINNSSYGFQGAREGAKRPFVQGAMSITFLGRQMIGKCQEYLKETYGAEIIYGDTDSVMVAMPNQIKHDSECDYWGKRVAGELTALFPKGINMQYENKARMFNIKKKAYWYYLLDGKGGYVMDKKTGKPYFITKGVLPARRDNAAICRDVYLEAAHMIMHREPMEKVLNYAFSKADDMVEGRIPLEKLEITKAMGANYKNNSCPMKVFMDALISIGRPAKPGDRLSYLIVERPGVKPLGLRKMLTSMYRDAVNEGNPPKIDYVYYLDRVLSHHFDQAFRIAYSKEIEYTKYHDLFVKPPRKRNPMYLTDPIKMYAAMYQMGDDIKSFLNRTNEVMDRYHKIQQGLINDDSAYLRATKFPETPGYDFATGQIVKPVIPEKPPDLLPPKKSYYAIDSSFYSAPQSSYASTSSSKEIIVIDDNTLIVEF